MRGDPIVAHLRYGKSFGVQWKVVGTMVARFLECAMVTYSIVEKISFMTILCHFGWVISNIRVNLDVSFQTFISHWTFLIILDNVTKDHIFY